MPLLPGITGRGQEESVQKKMKITNTFQLKGT
jgi:hypothetical protein